MGPSLAHHEATHHFPIECRVYPGDEVSNFARLKVIS